MSSRIQSPASALVAHVEHLVLGSRVLFIGSARNYVPSHLLARGARLVQVLDPDTKSVAHAAAHNTERRVSFAPLTDTSLRDAAFDCAIVEDLAQASDPQRLLLGVRRSIGPRGIALICSTSSDTTSGLLGVSPSTLGYQELVELTSSVFEESLMLGQAPFVGYAVVSLALDAPPEPCLDNEFLSESENADRFIAVCGAADAMAALDLEDMTIVQLPAGRVLEDGESEHRERERRAQRRIEALEVEVLELKKRSSPHEIEKLTRQLEERDSWIRDLEARAANAEARVDDLEAEQERLEAALAEIEPDTGSEAELLALRAELDSVRRAAARSQKETRWAEERVRKVERELEVSLAELDAALARAPVEPQPDEQRGLLLERVTNLEAQNQSLTQELRVVAAARTTLMNEVDDLEAELEESHRTLLESTAQLQAALAARAQAQEKVTKLEKRLAEAPSSAALSSPAPGEADQDVQRLETQLRERGRRITDLEEQLRRLEVFGKSLTTELTLAQGRTQVDQLEGELDHLAQSLAEREADLVAAEWTIGELKQRLLARPS